MLQRAIARPARRGIGKRHDRTGLCDPPLIQMVRRHGHRGASRAAANVSQLDPQLGDQAPLGNALGEFGGDADDVTRAEPLSQLEQVDRVLLIAGHACVLLVGSMIQARFFSAFEKKSFSTPSAFLRIIPPPIDAARPVT